MPGKGSLLSTSPTRQEEELDHLSDESLKPPRARFRGRTRPTSTPKGIRGVRRALVRRTAQHHYLDEASASSSAKSPVTSSPSPPRRGQRAPRLVTLEKRPDLLSHGQAPPSSGACSIGSSTTTTSSGGDLDDDIAECGGSSSSRTPLRHRAPSIFLRREVVEFYRAIHPLIRSAREQAIDDADTARCASTCATSRACKTRIYPDDDRAAPAQSVIADNVALVTRRQSRGGS